MFIKSTEAIKGNESSWIKKDGIQHSTITTTETSDCAKKRAESLGDEVKYHWDLPVHKSVNIDLL